MTKRKNPELPDTRYADAERKRQLVLDILWARGKLSQKEISDISFVFKKGVIGIPHSAVSNVVNALCANSEAVRLKDGTIEALKRATIKAEEVIAIRLARASQAQTIRNAAVRTASAIAGIGRTTHRCSDTEPVPERYAKANAVRRGIPGWGRSAIADCF